MPRLHLPCLNLTAGCFPFCTQALRALRQSRNARREARRGARRGARSGARRAARRAGSSACWWPWWGTAPCSTRARAALERCTTSCWGWTSTPATPCPLWQSCTPRSPWRRRRQQQSQVSSQNTGAVCVYWWSQRQRVPSVVTSQQEGHNSTVGIVCQQSLWGDWDAQRTPHSDLCFLPALSPGTAVEQPGGTVALGLAEGTKLVYGALCYIHFLTLLACSKGCPGCSLALTDGNQTFPCFPFLVLLLLQKLCSSSAVFVFWKIPGGNTLLHL